MKRTSSFGTTLIPVMPAASRSDGARHRGSRCGSVKPAAINLVNIHPSAGKVIVGRKSEGAGGPVVGHEDWLGGIVRVVSGKDEFVVGLCYGEENHGVIDGELRKPDE